MITDLCSRLVIKKTCKQYCNMNKFKHLQFSLFLILIHFTCLSQVTCFCPPPGDEDAVVRGLKQTQQQRLNEIDNNHKNDESTFFYPFGNRADGLQACKSHKILGCPSCSNALRAESQKADNERETVNKQFYDAFEKRRKEYCDDFCKGEIQKAKEEEEKQKQFDKIVDEADKLEKEGKYEEAAAKLKEAKGLKSDSDTSLNERISSLEKKKNEKKDNQKNETKNKDTTKASDKKKQEPPPKSPEQIYRESKIAEHELIKKQHKEQAAINNAAMVAIGTGVFKIWDLFQNEGKNHEFIDNANACSHFAVDLGLNIINMPLALNSVTEYKDKVGTVTDTKTETKGESPTFTNILLGVNYFPLLSDKLSVGFKGKIAAGPSFEAIAGGGTSQTIGNTSVVSNTHGFNFIMQGGTEVHVGRFLTSLDVIKKNWSYTDWIDSYDNVTGDGITINQIGSSQSTTIRYGAGLRLLKCKKKTNLDLMVLLDNLSYYNNKEGNLFASPVIFKACLWGQSIGKLNVEYSPSYPVAGIPEYNKTQMFKPYFSIEALLNITRFTEHNIDFNYQNYNQTNERRGELIGYINYNSMKIAPINSSISGLGVDVKYKKVLNTPRRENYIDFQAAANGTMASSKNEYKDYETIRLLNFSPDFRFTKKIRPSLYIGAIAGLNSLTIRNTIPYYDANVKFDSQHYFLQGSVGATIGLMYSRKATLSASYYYRPSIIGKGKETMIEAELAYKVVYFNATYITLPDYNSGYVYNRNTSILKAGIGCRMPW